MYLFRIQAKCQQRAESLENLLESRHELVTALQAKYPQRASGVLAKVHCTRALSIAEGTQR